MEAEITDAKTSDTLAGESSASNLDLEKFDNDSENIIETITDEVGGIDTSTGGARPQKEEPDKGQEEAKSTEEEKPSRYDLDPAWQRILRERDNAKQDKTDLLKRVEELEKSKAAIPEDITDITKLTNEEIAEWIEDDPKGYATNLEKLYRHNAQGLVRSAIEEYDRTVKEQQEKTKIDNTFDSYASKNPSNKSKTGFVEMWDSGKIQAYMDDNPGHNAISAHMALTEEERLSATVKAAVEDAKKKMTKEHQARIRTDGLGAGPSHTVGKGDDELQNTKQKGGAVAVLAKRLARMRKI